ncbi:MAG: zinc ribbon domain-containing protein [Thermoplasmata archaeon]
MAKKKPPVEEEEEPEVTCPVCGNPVTLEDPFCPHCGAEFEEEEVEEISIEEEAPEAPEEYEEPEAEEEAVEEEAEEEAEEEEVPEGEEEVTAEEIEAESEEVVEEEAAPEEEVVEVEEVVEEEEAPEEEVVEAEEEAAVEEAPKAKPAAATGLTDMRVFGIALLALGIIGLQIALFIRWYWTWVPPIDQNLGVYALLGFIIVIVAFLAFTMVKKSTEEKGKEYHPMLPTILLSIFVFGIFAVIFLLAGKPISDAMKDNQALLAVLFVVFIVVGVILYMMGQKRLSGAAA